MAREIYWKHGWPDVEGFDRDECTRELIELARKSEKKIFKDLGLPWFEVHPWPGNVGDEDADLSELW